MDSRSVADMLRNIYRKTLARLDELIEGDEPRQGELAILKTASQTVLYAYKAELVDSLEGKTDDSPTAEEAAELSAKVARLDEQMSEESE